MSSPPRALWASGATLCFVFALAAPGTGLAALTAHPTSGVFGGARAPLAADTPKVADTVRIVDTMHVVADTPAVADTLLVPLDEEEADTLAAPIELRNLPRLHRPVPAGWDTGVWEWDREGLLSTRALTLIELLEEIPGITMLRGGDHGQPTTVSGMGTGPGRVRVFMDGAEMPPLDGGMVDFSQIGLAGLDRVRVERRMGELRIELVGLQIVDPRTYTLLEVATGDLNTNLFRGTFAHPDALGGTLVVAIDRIDTEGSFRDEPGFSSGGQLRYSLFPWDGGGVALELRRMTARRPGNLPGDLWRPSQISRTDLNLRARTALTESLVADAFYHRASLGLDEEHSGPGADTLVATSAREQWGVGLSLDRGSYWAQAEARTNGKDDRWPDTRTRLQAGGSLWGYGGGSVGVEREGWNDQSGTTFHGRLWTRPLFGVSLYAEMDEGRRAVPGRVPIPPPAPDPDEDGEDDGGEEQNGDPDTEEDEDAATDALPFSDRSGLRMGAEFRRGELFLGAAYLRMDADSLYPSGIGMERDAFVLPGGERTGFEVAAKVPLRRILPGLSLAGSAQFWGEGPAWRHLPTESYDVQFRFHDVFLESRNLEVWSEVGVRGRNEILLPIPVEGPEATFAEVPFQQSWYARLQIRVLTVRVFVTWDNFTIRDRNQDYPDRLLPRTRALYGVRWTMWN